MIAKPIDDQLCTPAMGCHTLPDAFIVRTLHGRHIPFAELGVSVICDVLCTVYLLKELGEPESLSPMHDIIHRWAQLILVKTTDRVWLSCMVMGYTLFSSGGGS